MSLDPVVSLLVAVLVLLIGTVVNRKVYSFPVQHSRPDHRRTAVRRGRVGRLGDDRLPGRIDQTIKPVLLLMFFAGVGMCADLRMLKQGGKALVIFLLVLFPYIIVQNGVGVGSPSCWTCTRSSA